MTESQTTHPIYELKVDVSNTSRLFEYYMLKDYIKKDHIVLDIGCNTGTGLDILLGFSDNVYGIDVIPELESILRNKYSENKNVAFKIVKEGDIPFEDNFFDAIVANNFIEHVEDPSFYLTQFKRLLKPNGKLFLTTVNRKNRLYFWQKPYNVHHYTEFSPRSFESLLKKHFSEVESLGIIKGQPFFPDYLSEAANTKFKLAILFPVLNFLKKVKRIVLFRWKSVTVEQMNSQPENETRVPPMEKFRLEDFKNAFASMSVSPKDKNKWIELFSICKK